MSSQEMESFFGTIFSPSSESSPSESSAPDTSLSVSSSSDESSLLSTLLNFLKRKGLYVLGAIIVLILIIWLYRKYQYLQRHQRFEHFEEHFLPRADASNEPFEDDEILTEDMIIDSERSAMPTPSLPEPFSLQANASKEPVRQPPPPSVNSENPLIKLEQQLTKVYSEFEKAASAPEKDIRSLHPLVSAMASILAKMKEHVLPVLQSEQAPNDLKQQLQQGLQDAELIVTMAQNKMDEMKRIQTASENDQETKSVVKNMHYLGLGNKIKKAKGHLPAV